MAKWSNEKMADLTRKLADTAIEQNELYQAVLRDAKEAEAYAEELEAKLAQQDDLVQAAVAAALREAATLCANVSTADLKVNNPTYEEGYSNGAGVCHYEILALITTDAQDALDWAIAAAIRKGGE